MRFIHTADWHLGRIFHNVSLLEDQNYILKQLIKMIEQNKPDAVIIAGDVYDKAIPSEGAVNLLTDFINQVAGLLNIPIIIISGNHDSGTRLSFASSILEKANVHIIGKTNLDTTPIILNDEFGEVYFYPLPYLSPLAARSLYQDAEIKSHQDVIKRQVSCIAHEHPKDKRSVLIMHEFVIGAEESESERQLSVGGTSSIESGILQQFDYVAMGHIHSPQAIGNEYIRYSGSLLKYSFSEVKHDKGITEISLNADGFSSCQHISLKPLRDMRIISGTLDDILNNAVFDPNVNDFLCAELLDKGELYDPMRQLQERYPNTLEIRRISQSSSKNINTQSFKDLHKQNVPELFDAFYQHVCSEPLDDTQTEFVTSIVEQLDHSGTGVN